MKKLSLIGYALILLTACRNTGKHAVKPDWSAYRKAYSFLGTNADSAFFYFNKAAADSSDKKQTGFAYFNMATIQSDAGDYYGAQESLTKSLDALDRRDTSLLTFIAGDYNELGMSFAALNQHAEALRYYQKALQFKLGPNEHAIVLNNEGNSFKASKAIKSAIASYQQALSYITKKNDLYARTLTNLATAKWLQHGSYDPVPEFLSALAIRTRLNDGAGENSSYDHIADYYLQRRADSALWYARRMLVAAGKLHNADDQLSALQKLITLSAPGESKNYFSRYQSINDSVTNKRNAAKNQFALIRYNVAQQQNVNLELQKQNTEKAYQLAGLACIGLLAGAGGFWLYRLNQRRLKAEAEAALQNSRLQLSQKVHDKVANGIYRVISEIEHKPELEKEAILDKLDHIYGVSRDITHESEAPDGEDFAAKLAVMLNDLKPAAVKLALSGNESELWEQVKLATRAELELILQELMVNMSKHSEATQALITFIIKREHLHVDYKDNGIGIQPKHKPGKGLDNTVSRIKALSGHVKFGEPAAKGFSVHLQIPLA